MNGRHALLQGSKVRGIINVEFKAKEDIFLYRNCFLRTATNGWKGLHEIPPGLVTSQTLKFA